MGERDVIGLGVAGNFAGHLEQAGEASDFVDVVVEDAAAPKGIFPFYVPGQGEHFLHVDPISDSEIRLGADDEQHQIEPEVALLCDLRYDEGRVAAIEPRFAMAHNDCSIRRPGAKKISEKKNWGGATKGTSSQRIALDGLQPGGTLDHFRLACFLERDDALNEYGQDSAVASYSYFHTRLLDWLVAKMNEQEDGGPLEHIAGWLEVAGHPARALISIGATRYTDYGERTFLERGDRSIVILYDAEQYDAAAVRHVAAETTPAPRDGMSILSQRVV